MMKSVSVATLVLLMGSGAANAVTVSNTGAKAFTVGIDMGNKEVTQEVAAGKSAKISGCDSGCGVTGPWGYSKWANTGDTIKSDGAPLVTVK